ncbi:MAG: hypothetical protein FJ135_04445 [Deltaproteobacteria bacterium]|nr:hypothetical protein [Deltaproteobacteria bacterium]
MAGINLIPEDKEKDLTITWFYDDIPQEYRDFRKFAQAVEQEYQELQKLLAEATEKLKTEGSDAELQAREKYLKKRIDGMEKKFPWLLSELLLEYALWGVPH